MSKNWTWIPLILLVSCSGTEGTNDTNGNPSQNNVTIGNPTVYGDVDPNINFYMTFDLLGGVFRRPNQGSAASMQLNTEPGTVSKSSSATEPAAFQREAFTVDYSRQYIGFENKGKMSLSVFGEGEEVFPPNDPESVVRHFNPLTLRFVFHDFAFNNPCIGVVRLKGEIACTVEGDYDMQTEEFLGEAFCQNGPLDNRLPVLYKVPQREYSVEMDVQLMIDGNPYRYRSYSYDGAMTIDGEELSVKDNIWKGASCSQP